MKTEIKPQKNLFKWHQWFAWHPVTAKDLARGTEHIIWLEKINRKYTLNPDAHCIRCNLITVEYKV